MLRLGMGSAASLNRGCLVPREVSRGAAARRVVLNRGMTGATRALRGAAAGRGVLWSCLEGVAAGDGILRWRAALPLSPTPGCWRILCRVPCAAGRVGQAVPTGTMDPTAYRKEQQG